MGGYFYSLIELTGMRLGSEAEPGPAVGRTSTFDTDRPTGPVPIEVEEQIVAGPATAHGPDQPQASAEPSEAVPGPQVIPRQPGEPGGFAESTPPTVSEIPAGHTGPGRAGSDVPSNDEVSLRPPAGGTPTKPSGRTRGSDQTAFMEIRQGPASGADKEDRITSGPSGRAAPGDREARIDIHDVVIEASADRGRQVAVPGVPTQPGAPASGDQEPALEPVSKAERLERTRRAEVWQATYQKVREWVAASPPAESEPAPVPKAAAEPEAGKFAATSQQEPGRGEPAVTSYKEPGRSASAEPEAEDFHLSIGSISVSVEGQPEGARIARPERGRREPPKKRLRSTRLSRHYLRTR
jgi:hypothetical protein